MPPDGTELLTQLGKHLPAESQEPRLDRGAVQMVVRAPIAPDDSRRRWGNSCGCVCLVRGPVSTQSGRNGHVLVSPSSTVAERQAMAHGVNVTTAEMAPPLRVANILHAGLTGRQESVA